jgi:hypothetical protein
MCGASSKRRNIRESIFSLISQVVELKKFYQMIHTNSPHDGIYTINRPIKEDVMGGCYTKGASGTFGPEHGQPTDLRKEKYAYCGDFWFYNDGSADNPAFGFNNVVIRIAKQSPTTASVKLIYNNNGHQGGSGATPYSHPITIGFYSGDFPEASVEGVPYDVPCHSSDYREWNGEIAFLEGKFDTITVAKLEPGTGFSVTC